jgi:phasin family protein
MITETLSALTTPTLGVLEPIRKLNKAIVASAEKLTARQIASLTTYSQLGLSQLRAATEVKDVDGLQTLVAEQKDVLKACGERLWADTKAVAEMGVDFVAEAQKVGSEVAPAATPAKAKAA